MLKFLMFFFSNFGLKHNAVIKVICLGSIGIYNRVKFQFFLLISGAIQLRKKNKGESRVSSICQSPVIGCGHNLQLHWACLVVDTAAAASFPVT